MPNVEFLGEKPYAELTHYLYAFDVCLIPFKVVDLTRATNPVKVYEYLCAGLSRAGALVTPGGENRQSVEARSRMVGLTARRAKEMIPEVSVFKVGKLFLTHFLASEMAGETARGDSNLVR